MLSFDAGTTPKDTILDALDADKDIAEHGGYYMRLTGNDAHVVRSLVNRGIDSHLEGILFEGTPKVEGSTLTLTVKPESVPVLLRRLWEACDSGPYEREVAEVPFDEETFRVEAFGLRSSILHSLGIEEI